MITPIKLSNIAQNASKLLNKGCNKLGNYVSNSNKAQGIIKKFDPTHANNTFLGLLTLMTCCVIFPRVKTAATRNPDNKEATKDEIVEILFRDIQTVGIILFALKMMNTLISRGASNLTGVPLTNKTFTKVFDTDSKGIKGLQEKGRELLEHPIQKLKNIGKNILDTIHPTGGVVKLNNKDFINKYSGFGSIEEVNKLYSEIAGNNGDIDKIHEMVMDDIIKNQEAIIKRQELISHSGFPRNTKKAEEILEKLKSVKEQGVAALQDKKLDKNVQNLIVNFFKNPDNKLVRKGKTLNAYLSTLALAIESLYLGFGLPALNQRRLEKKYLNDNKKLNISQEPMSKISSIQKRLLKPNEAQIFQKFIK